MLVAHNKCMLLTHSVVLDAKPQHCYDGARIHPGFGVLSYRWTCPGGSCDAGGIGHLACSPRRSPFSHHIPTKVCLDQKVLTEFWAENIRSFAMAVAIVTSMQLHLRFSLCTMCHFRDIVDWYFATPNRSSIFKFQNVTWHSWEFQRVKKFCGICHSILVWNSVNWFVNNLHHLESHPTAGC